MTDRERFETEAIKRGVMLEDRKRNKDGSYFNYNAEFAWEWWQAAFEAGRSEGLEQAAKVAEYHHANHCENRDTDYRNCGSAIATGIRDLKEKP